MMEAIRYGSIWKAKVPLTILIDSHTRNPNGRPILLPIGTEIKWDGDSPNGNVWFIVAETKQRGKMEAGSIFNVLNRLELVSMGDSFIAYQKEYVNKRLNT